MDNSTEAGAEASAEGVSASTAEAQASSPEAKENNSQFQDLTKNLKAEMNRKFSKMNEQLSRIASFVEQAQKVQTPVEETRSLNQADPKTFDKQYIDSLLFEKERTKAVAVHNEQFEEAKKALPELDENSDQYDSEFFKSVDRYYSKLVKADPTDPNAFRDALELAGVKSGKTERLVKEKILKDEARRSRLIAEGGSIPKDTKKEKEPSLKLTEEQRSRLQRKLGINPDKLEARLKKGQ